MKQTLREKDFIRNFNNKKRIADLYKVQYKVKFSDTEISNYSPNDLIRLGDEKRYRIITLKRENQAAITIQTLFRRHLAKKEYTALRDAYITPYGYNLKDLAKFKTAAMKIQQYYRFIKHAKEVIKNQEVRNLSLFQEQL